MVRGEQMLIPHSLIQCGISLFIYSYMVNYTLQKKFSRYLVDIYYLELPRYFEATKMGANIYNKYNKNLGAQLSQK
jgi:hypothetical protein